MGAWRGKGLDIHDGDVNFSKAALDLTDVDLFELPVTDIRFLVGHASMSAGDGGGGEGGGEDEAGCIRADHIDKVIRASNVAADRAVRFSEST